MFSCSVFLPAKGSNNVRMHKLTNLSLRYSDGIPCCSLSSNVRYTFADCLEKLKSTGICVFKATLNHKYTDSMQFHAEICCLSTISAAHLFSTNSDLLIQPCFWFLLSLFRSFEFYIGFSSERFVFPYKCFT